MNIYILLKHLHSGWRYAVLALVIIAIGGALSGWFGKKGYTEANRKINLFALISVHIQILVGLALYFLSPKVALNDMASTMKDGIARYWTVEHAVMMILAAVLITIGHSKSKKRSDGTSKHKTIAIFYGLAIIIVLVSIQMSGIPILGMS